MAKKLMRYKYEPFRERNRTEKHTIFSLCIFCSHLGVTENEMERIVMGDLDERVSIKHVGVFYRYQ